MKKQNVYYDNAYIEYDWGLAELSPRQRADRIIKRLKGNTYGQSRIQSVSLDRLFFYLVSENCDLTWEQKDFVIYLAFDSASDVFSLNFGTRVMTSALERWGIIDALKLYNNDEKTGINWFESHKIPMQHVYRIVNNARFFESITNKYPELQTLRNKYLQYKCEHSVNEVGRISCQQYDTLLKQDIELLKKGDYDKSHYEVLKVIGQEDVRYVSDTSWQFLDELNRQIPHITTKENLIKYLELRRELNWMNERFSFTSIFQYESCTTIKKHMLTLLGVDEADTDIKNFDLKNTKDIQRCKKMFPLVLDYPFLFLKWYSRSNSRGYFVNGVPLCVPDYDNILEKKRKALNFKLGTKGFVGKIASKTVVPKKLGKLGTKLEQIIAASIYNKIRPGRW